MGLLMQLRSFEQGNKLLFFREIIRSILFFFLTFYKYGRCFFSKSLKGFELLI